MVNAESVEQFIAKWSGRAGKESADSQSFLNDLCQLLEVPRPHDANPGFGPEDYMFEVGIDRVLGDVRIGKGEIDVYRRGCFVLESKQGGITKTEALATGIRANKGTATRGTRSWASSMQEALKQARVMLTNYRASTCMCRILQRQPSMMHLLRSNRKQTIHCTCRLCHYHPLRRPRANNLNRLTVG